MEGEKLSGEYPCAKSRWHSLKAPIFKFKLAIKLPTRMYHYSILLLKSTIERMKDITFHQTYPYPTTTITITVAYFLPPVHFPNKSENKTGVKNNKETLVSLCRVWRQPTIKTSYHGFAN